VFSPTILAQVIDSLADEVDCQVREVARWRTMALGHQPEGGAFLFRRRSPGSYTMSSTNLPRGG